MTSFEKTQLPSNEAISIESLLATATRTESTEMERSLANQCLRLLDRLMRAHETNALQKYARHSDGCRTRDWTSDEKSWDDATCDCGLREALRPASNETSEDSYNGSWQHDVV